jgi:hypothetical protein
VWLLFGNLSGELMENVMKMLKIFASHAEILEHLTFSVVVLKKLFLILDSSLNEIKIAIKKLSPISFVLCSKISR